MAKKNSLYLFLIAVIVFVSTHKMLGFYFWHDDFSWFYAIRTNSCFNFWPYHTFCMFLGKIDSVLDYNAWRYYFLGSILLVFLSSVFFFFASLFFSKPVSFLLASIFSTIYIGSGVLQEAYDPIMVFIPLALLYSSMIFLHDSKKKETTKFLLAFVAFFLSVWLAPIRSSSNMLVGVAFVMLILTKLPFRKRVLLSLAVCGVWILAFFVFPGGVRREVYEQNFAIHTLTNLDPLHRIVIFLQTLGAFIIPDTLVDSNKIDNYRGVLGLSILCLYFIGLYIRRKSDAKVGLFALILLAAFYLPYGLVSDLRLDSTHRYFVFAFSGALLMWGFVCKSYPWKYISVAIILFGICQTNFFLKDSLIQSKKRADFYSQLHVLVPQIKKDSVLFFDSPAGIKNQFDDYFRVGYLATEASLGTEYSTNYKDFKLITEGNSKEIKGDNLFVYYYDGEKITDLTDRVKDVSSQEIEVNQSEKNKFILNTTSNEWTGENSGISINLADRAILPFKLKVGITAFFPEVPLPYTQGCVNCSKDPSVNKQLLETFRPIQSPAAYISTQGEVEALKKYLSHGVKACFNWNTQTEFTLFVDGKYHSYELELPARAYGRNLELKCLNYPVDVTVHEAETNFVTGGKNE